MESKSLCLKNVFEYDNYRTYLKAVYESSKAMDKKFSYRYFSRLIGFQSPSFLKHVIEGKRNLSLVSIEKFVLAFKLNKEQAHFFKNLVFLNQGTTVEERHRFSEEIL